MPRWSRTIVALLAGVVVAGGCGGTDAEPRSAGDGTPRSGGTLVVATAIEVAPLDPNRQSYWETFRITRHIFEQLVTEDLSSSDGSPELVPGLATGWEVSDDAKTFTFTLREGVTFHDGTPFDAEALHDNVRRYTDPAFEFYDEQSAGNLSSVYADLASSRVVDDHTYEYTFSRPFLDFPRRLAEGTQVSAVFSPAALREYGNDGLAEHPVGTGPYVFVERVDGEHVTIERNEDYWGDAPYLDTIIFRPITNDQSRIAALEAGEVDIAPRTPADDAQRLLDAGFQLPEGTGAAINYLQFNFENEFVRDVGVRRAFIQALDRDGLVEQVYGGYPTPAHSILNPGNEAYDPDAVDYEYDPEAARQTLQDAGYEPGEISFTLVTAITNQSIAEWIQRDYAEVGIEVEIEALDSNAFLTRNANRTPDDALSFGDWGEVPASWLAKVYQFSVVARGGEEYVSQELKDALAAAQANADESRRIDLWRQVDERFRDEAVVIPLLSLAPDYALAPHVQGFVFPQQNWYDLTSVWIDE